MNIKSKADKNLFVSKILFFGIIISSLIIGLYLTSAIAFRISNNTFINYIDNWTVTDKNGNSFETGKSYYDDRAYKEDFTITSRLPAEIDNGSVLYFLNRSNLKVYINGTLRMEFDRETDTNIPGGTLKDFYVTVPLTEADSGGSLKMERGRTDWNPMVVPETIVTSNDGIYNYMMGKYGTSFIMTLLLFAASLIVVVIAIVMRIWSKRTIEMLYAAISILDVACWLLSVSQIVPLITRIYLVDGTMGYLFTMMIPFGLLIYLNILQKHRYTKCYTILFLLSLISFVLWTILHFTGILSFQNSLFFIDGLLVLISVCELIILALDFKHKHIKEYIYSAIAIIAFFTMGIIQIFVLLFIPKYFNELPMIIGLLFLLVLIVIQQADDIRKVKKQLESEINNEIEQKEQLIVNIVQTLADTIDAKDSYTNGHSSRVAAYSREIARRCGYSEEEQNNIYIIALLHDIGKIGVPDAIIQKEGRLSDEELSVIKKHPETGNKILKNIKSNIDFALGARWHHERYDGKGYPDGIKGDEIPEQARIITVADAYDAMTSYRSYRDPLPHEKVLNEIRNGMGTQFDPRFAKVMIEMMEEDTGYDLREKKK